MSVAAKSLWFRVIVLVYASRAIFSCLHPQEVAFVVNLNASGYEITFTKLCAGLAGSVQHADFILDAVIRPALKVNQSLELL